jgi:hypothetical protein
MAEPTGISLRSEFPGHFRDSSDKIVEAWKTHTFVFDTNILLNFFRYSASTRADFETVVRSIRDRVWLPYRVAYEYFRTKDSLITGETKNYNNTIKTITELTKSLEAPRKHPFVSPETLSTAKNAFELLLQELNENRDKFKSTLSNDVVSEFFDEIFMNKLGTPYSPKEIEELMKEGDHRYTQKIPPGFMDAKKGEGAVTMQGQIDKYGDLLIWKDIIKLSKESGKGIIFVTDDSKLDWWSIIDEFTLGPRPELVKEFQNETSNTIYFYNAERFLEFARTSLQQNVSTASVDEVREIREIAGDSIQTPGLNWNSLRATETDYFPIDTANLSPSTRERILKEEDQIIQFQRLLASLRNRKSRNEIHYSSALAMSANEDAETNQARLLDIERIGLQINADIDEMTVRIALAKQNINSFIQEK